MYVNEQNKIGSVENDDGYLCCLLVEETVWIVVGYRLHECCSTLAWGGWIGVIK